LFASGKWCASPTQIFNSGKDKTQTQQKRYRYTMIILISSFNWT
jgi:hypothetical protein